MVYSAHFPDKKSFDKFRALLKEAKNLSGATQHRILISALTNYVNKLIKEQS